MSKGAGIMDAGCAILECFAEPMRTKKCLLVKAEFHGNYERISLHVFFDWEHSTIPRAVTMKVGSNSSHLNQRFLRNFKLGQKEAKEGNGTIHVDEEAFGGSRGEAAKYKVGLLLGAARYVGRMDYGRNAAGNLHLRKWFISKSGERVRIAGKNCAIRNGA